MIRFLLALLLCTAPALARAQPGLVHAITHAECQFENDAQRRAIVALLHDLETLPTSRLRTRRYPDYAGNPDRWTAAEAFRHDCVVDTPIATDAERFYHLRETPSLRAAFRALRQRVQGG